MADADDFLEFSSMAGFSYDDDDYEGESGYDDEAKTLFDKGDYSGYSEQYIDLWVEILQISRPVF